MSAHDIMMSAHVAHVRELKNEIGRLREENLHLRSECESLLAHFDLALLAAGDLRGMQPDERLEIWDGWNLILGTKEAPNREALIGQARKKTAEDPTLRVWIVFDGPKESSRVDGRVRVSYTGGAGAHRADRMVVDYIRMAVWLGLEGRVSVRTNDKDFRRQVARLLT